MKFFIYALLITSIGCSQSAKKNSDSTPPSSYQGLGKESVDPETMKKYAPPGLPSEVAGKIQRMLDIQTPGAGMIHPDESTLFFTWRISGNTQVWKIKGPQKFPVQMTGGRDATSLVSITPDGKYLILERDIDGQENPGVYLQNPNGGALIKVYHKPKVRASFQYVTDDSKYIYFTANEANAESFYIYRTDIQKNTTELFFSEKGLWSIADYRDGTFLLTKWTGSRTSEIYSYEEKTKTLKPVIGQDTPEEYTATFAAQKGAYLVLTPKIGNFRRLYLLKAGKLEAISPEIKYDVSSFNIDKNRKRILYEVNEEGYTRLHAMDANQFRTLKLPQFPGADHVLAGSTTRNSKITMISVINSKSPRVSYSYDWAKQKLTQWTLPSVPEVDLGVFVPATLEKYTARDGTAIPMFVRRPPQCLKQTCPVIVQFHGGPEGQSYPGFSTFAQLILDEGFIYVEPNVRGSDGYGKEWLNSDNAAKRLDVITDIEDCAIHIKKHWSKNGVTPKIGIMGGSYGGYSTLMGMTYFAGTYDSGVAIVGMSNLLTFLNNTAPYRRILRATEYGDPVKDKEALIKLSPVTYVDRVKAPLMIIQGANDPRVPVGEAIQIQKIMQDKKLKSQLIIFPDEGHGSQKKENRVLEWGHTLNFFKQTLM